MPAAGAARAAKRDPDPSSSRSDAFTDLALTLPIFLVYHLGVIFLPVKNAADPVTQELRTVASSSMPAYVGLTLAVGAAFIAVLFTLGRRQAFQKRRFFMVALEGTVYAVLMRFAGAYVVGSLRLGPPGGGGIFTSVVMSLGAGLYEEIAFRVGLFGVGAFVLRRIFAPGLRTASVVAWAVFAALVFSGWHYVGALGDDFQLQSFVFRAVCGLVLTAIFRFRGFAPAVWTHALYDVWVMVL
jgi:hypothetical protein